MSDRPETARRLRSYSITVDGWDPETFIAPTASAARYKAFKAFCDGTKRMPFKEFLDRSSTLPMGVAR